MRVFSVWQGFLRVHRLNSWTFAFHCVGSTGANVFAYTGALSFWFLIVGSTGACSIVLRPLWTTAPAMEIDFVGLTGVRWVILRSLWTTAPALGLDFVGLTSALFFSCWLFSLTGWTDVYKFIHVGSTGDTYCVVLLCCQLCLTGWTDVNKCILVGSTGDIYCASEWIF